MYWLEEKVPIVSGSALVIAVVIWRQAQLLTFSQNKEIELKLVGRLVLLV